MTGAVLELATETLASLDQEVEEGEGEAEQRETLKKVEKQEMVGAAGRVSHYGNVETQINVENLYLSLDTGYQPQLLDDKYHYYFNPQFGKINRILSNFLHDKNTTNNSPMLLKLRTDL